MPMQLFGCNKYPTFPGGIPSHDTFGRVFSIKKQKSKASVGSKLRKAAWDNSYLEQILVS
ncbi:MAG: hypothetical protein ABFD49_04655 [Armatimonadota bacterium]|nr:hypothetical protein [bacterium]